MQWRRGKGRERGEEGEGEGERGEEWEGEGERGEEGEEGEGEGGERYDDYLMLHNSAIGFDQGLCIKWRLSKQHLIDADSKRPPITFRSIYTLAVLHGCQDLR